MMTEEWTRLSTVKHVWSGDEKAAAVEWCPGGNVTPEDISMSEPGKEYVGTYWTCVRGSLDTELPKQVFVVWFPAGSK